MMCAAFRARPFPDSQVLDVLVYVSTFRTGLTASKPLVDLDQVIALILEHVDERTPTAVGYSLR